MSPQLILLIAALLLVAIYFQQSSKQKNIIYRSFKRYPAEVFVKLHERATAAAGAWVDEIDTDAYLGIEHTYFFVKRNKICVRLQSNCSKTVDVLFMKQHDGWKRANIMYGGKVIR
jgi:hypothetical protein